MEFLIWVIIFFLKAQCIYFYRPSKVMVFGAGWRALRKWVSSHKEIHSFLARNPDSKIKWWLRKSYLFFEQIPIIWNKIWQPWFFWFVFVSRQKWTARNLDNHKRGWFCQYCCRKKQQYRQNRIVLIVLTKAWQPWLQKCHTYGVLGFVRPCSS